MDFVQLYISSQVIQFLVGNSYNRMIYKANVNYNQKKIKNNINFSFTLMRILIKSESAGQSIT